MTGEPRHNASSVLGPKAALVWIALALVGIVVLAFVMSGFAFPRTATFSTSSSGQTSSAEGVPPFNQTVLQAHLNKLDRLNVNGADSDYSDNAVVVWTGASGTSLAYGGTYNGPNSIRDLLDSVVGTATNMSVIIRSFTAKAPSASRVESVNATLFLLGNSTVVGQVTANIDAQYQFVYTDGVWLISQESWDYKTFTTQFNAGETTFPQWQTVGPPLPQRYSESPFKNWVYFYGGAAAAVAIAGYLASIPVLVRLRPKAATSRPDVHENPIPRVRGQEEGTVT